MTRALTIAPNPPLTVAGRSDPRARAETATVIDAQVAGQTGARRGLRGGIPVLDAARSAYLDAEWRGEGDRRLPAGTIRKVTL
jgi:hypothetical protein